MKDNTGFTSRQESMAPVNNAEDMATTTPASVTLRELTLLEALSLELDIDKMAPHALQEASRIVGVEGGAVALFNFRSGLMNYRWYVGLGEDMPFEAMQRPFSADSGLAGMVAKLGRTMVIENYPDFEFALPSFVEGGIRSAMTTPIRDNTGKIIGVLSLASINRQHTFTAAHMHLVEMLAKQFSIALYREKLAEQQETYARALKTLSRCNEAVIHAEGEIQLLQDVCNIVIQEKGYIGAWAGFKGSDSYKSLVPRAVAGVSLESLLDVEYSWNIKDKISGHMPPGRAVRDGKLVYVRDVYEEKDCERCQQLAKEFGYRSVIALPLRINSEVIGVLTIYADGVNAFSEQEQALFSGLSENLSFGIQNLRTQAAKEFAAKQQRESEQRFRAIFDNAREGIVAIDVETFRVQTANEYFANMLGCPAAELVGQELDGFFLDEESERIHAMLGRAIKNGRGFVDDVKIRRTGESPRYVDIKTSPLSVGEHDYLLNIIHDITDRKEVEQNLRNIINDEADGVLVLDNEDQVVFTNPAYAKLLGREEKDIVGSKFSHPLPTGKPLQVDLVHANGETIPCEIHINRTDWEKRPSRIVSIHDMSQAAKLEKERELSLKRQQEILVDTITAMSHAVETRDPYTAGHMHRVSELAIAIARVIGLDKEQIEGLRLGAIIHDIGKLYVPAEILNRPGKLSMPEFEMIKSHCQVGYDIVKGINFPWPVADMVYQHHERVDGSGYPNGLLGNEITYEARILAVADVLEAISSHRPYRPSLGITTGLDELRKNRGKLYDTDVVDACIEVVKQGYSIE